MMLHLYTLDQSNNKTTVSHSAVVTSNRYFTHSYHLFILL